MTVWPYRATIAYPISLSRKRVISSSAAKGSSIRRISRSVTKARASVPHLSCRRTFARIALPNSANPTCARVRPTRASDSARCHAPFQRKAGQFLGEAGPWHPRVGILEHKPIPLPSAPPPCRRPARSRASLLNPAISRTPSISAPRGPGIDMNSPLRASRSSGPTRQRRCRRPWYRRQLHNITTAGSRRSCSDRGSLDDHRAPKRGSARFSSGPQVSGADPLLTNRNVRPCENRDPVSPRRRATSCRRTSRPACRSCVAYAVSHRVAGNQTMPATYSFSLATEYPS